MSIITAGSPMDGTPVNFSLRLIREGPINDLNPYSQTINNRLEQAT